VLCGCPALRAVVYAITGSLLLPSMSLYLDTIQNEFNWTGNYESTPGWGLSVWSLHVLPVYAWVLSGYFLGFLPLSKNMHVRLVGVSKIVLRSECEHVCGCLSRLSLCSPVTDWWPVQGVPRLSPDYCWDRLQPPRDPIDWLSGYRKWMMEVIMRMVIMEDASWEI